MATFWATNSKNGYFWFQHLVTLAPSLSDAQPDCETLSRVNNELRHKSSSTRDSETLLQSLLIFVNEILCKFCVQNRFQTRKKPEEKWVEVVLFPRLKTLKIKICCINLNTMLIFSARCRSARFPDTAAAPISATLVAMDKAQWSKDWLPSQAIWVQIKVYRNIASIRTSCVYSIDAVICWHLKIFYWEVVVAQLVERSLLTPEVRGSNPNVLKDENKEKIVREWPN